MSDKEVRDVITGALEILADEENWVKGVENQVVSVDDLMMVREQSCLWGAIKRSVCPEYYRVPHPAGDLNKYEMQANNAASLIGKVISEQYPDRLNTRYDNNSRAIIPFNDHPETVHSEVIAVLEKALAQ